MGTLRVEVSSGASLIQLCTLQLIDQKVDSNHRIIYLIDHFLSALYLCSPQQDIFGGLVRRGKEPKETRRE